MKASRNYPALAILSGILLAGVLVAQNPGIKRTVIARADLSTPGKEAIVANVEIAPGASAGRHTHPGEEITNVIEGEGDLIIAGQPVRHIKAGEGFIVPAGAIHDAHNTGTQTLKMAAVYVVEKGKPLATPAP